MGRGVGGAGDLPGGLLRAEGVGRQWGKVPDPITSEWLHAQNAQDERILRLQYEHGPKDFPEDWDAELGALEGEDIMSALRRRLALTHFWRVHREGLRSASADEAGVRALDRLLRREPVVVQVCGERVEVTGRSYAAMAEMAAHGLARDQAADAAERARELYHEVRSKGVVHRLRHRRRLRRLKRLHQVAYTEAEAHRRAFWAHALTPDGGPAEIPDDDPRQGAPEWVDRIGPAEHGVLLGALIEAGPGRGARLPEPDKPRKGDDELDRFGGLSLLAAWGVKTGVEPASTLHRDYGQVLAELTAWGETQPDLDDREYF